MAGGGSGAGAGGKGGAGAPAAGGQPNIYNQASGATNAAYGANNAYLGELARGPGGVTARTLGTPATGTAQSYNATGYTPSTYTGQGYTGQGYGAQGYTGQGYNAAQQATPEAISSGIAGYMNPYTQDVVDATGRDIRQQTQLGINDLGATAAGQGAFGGSRLGVAEGVASAEGARALGDITGKLRSAGFDTAAQLSGQDIANRMAAAGANQAAINQALQYSTGARNEANQWSAGARNEASRFGADASNVANQYTAGARNTANQWNAGARNTAGEFGASARNTAGQWNAGQRADVNSANADRFNRVGEINRDAYGAADTANLAQRNTWLQNLAGAAGSSMGLGERGVSLGQQIQGATGADANAVNSIVQGLMGQSAGMHDSYTSAPLDNIARTLGLLSGNPLSGTGTTTGTQTPGLKSMLSTAAGAAARIPMGGA